MNDNDELPSGRHWLENALASLAHRGPDDGGLWAAPSGDLVLGHCRLSIIDLSPLGHQPMVSDDQRTAIVFNGEVYNFQELRQELESAGITFRSRSDTEVVLKGYQYWGEAVLERLVGMFAFAIWDAGREQVFLARDRAGEKPLYYADYRGGFAFASEIAPLGSLPGVDGEIDQEALALYLLYQYIPAPHSIYRGVRKLSPGHAMRVTRRKTEIWRYWDPVEAASGRRLDVPEEEASERLEALMGQAVKGQMISDVPLGAFLSGGIDSSMVVSLMAQHSSRPVKTFTIGFDVPEYNEAEYAEAVAHHIGTEHTTEYCRIKDALDLIPALPGIYGEPFADSSALPTRMVSHITRKHVTVGLSGDGGDEVMGGYSRYSLLGRYSSFGVLSAPLAPLLRPLLARGQGRLQRISAMLGQSRKEFYRSLVTGFMLDEVIALTGVSPTLSEFDRAWDAKTKLALRQKSMLADMLTYLPEDVLVKVDRAAMSVSLETRAPFLDHRVLEFALRLPVRFVKDKHLLKQMLFKRVPRELLEREKKGFAVPLAEWFRLELRDLLESMLTKDRIAAVGLRNYGMVRRYMDEHQAGVRNHSYRLWALLMLVMWKQTHP